MAKGNSQKPSNGFAQQLAADFIGQTRPLVERIIANLHESRILAALRDALLPKLLSGQLRLPAKTVSLDL
jgi:hypothetical protein